MEVGGLSHASRTKQARKSLRGPARAGSSMAVPLWIRKSGVQIPAPVFFKPQRLSYDIFLRSGWSLSPLLRCSRCGLIKTNVSFARKNNDPLGRQAMCRDCHSEYHRAYHQENKSKRTPEITAWQKQNRDKVRATAARWSENHPDRVSARNKVANELKYGRLVKTPCVHCGSTKRVQGHHPDYTKPLEVIWLCQSCHAAEHLRLRTTAETTVSNHQRGGGMNHSLTSIAGTHRKCALLWIGDVSYRIASARVKSQHLLHLSRWTVPIDAAGKRVNPSPRLAPVAQFDNQSLHILEAACTPTRRNPRRGRRSKHRVSISISTTQRTPPISTSRRQAPIHWWSCGPVWEPAITTGLCTPSSIDRIVSLGSKSSPASRSRKSSSQDFSSLFGIGSAQNPGVDCAALGENHFKMEIASSNQSTPSPENASRRRGEKLPICHCVEKALGPSPSAVLAKIMIPSGEVRETRVRVATVGLLAATYKSSFAGSNPASVSKKYGVAQKGIVAAPGREAPTERLGEGALKPSRYGLESRHPYQISSIREIPSSSRLRRRGKIVYHAASCYGLTQPESRHERGGAKITAPGRGGKAPRVLMSKSTPAPQIYGEM